MSRHPDPLDDPDRLATPAEAVASELAEAMAAAWGLGDRTGAEDLLASHPEVADRPEAAVRLIYEEWTLRLALGEEPDETALLARFPRWRAELAMLLACDRLVRPGSATTTAWPGAPTGRYPGVGDRIGGFLLIEELGSGATGRTFLATDPDLGDRPVVLKLTPRGLGEHVALARLQHTNVVPLFAAPEFPEHDLRALCMPYLGGTSLDRVLAEIGSRPERPSGRSIVEAVDRGRAGSTVPVVADGQSRRLLAALPYPEAIAWIAARLADALHAAHGRGLVHMDVKPANVLVAADGTPMLLDFHLAREPVRPGGPRPSSIGGTPGAMAPEQLAAMEAVREGRPVAVDVDGRADVHALGRLMAEALAVPGAAGSASPGLRAIVGRCLEADPRDRYPDAASLNDDLRRHLEDLPLRGVPDRSPAERWEKWRRRSPQALVRWGLLALAAAGLLGLAVETRSRRLGASAMLDRARDAVARHRIEDALNAADAGLALLRHWPGGEATRRGLVEVRDEVLRRRAARNLHALVDRLRFVRGADVPASRLAPLRDALPRLRDAWAAGRELDRRAADDLRDLALLGSALDVKLAEGDDARRRAHREALATLDDAEALLGPSRSLAEARRSHAEALGLADLARRAAVEARAIEPASASEFHAVGLGRLRDGDRLGALDALGLAVDLDPRGFWPLFHRGVAAFELGRFDDAHADFHACVALAPDSAECYYNRARALDALGHPERALRDDARALDLDPGFAEPALHSGLIRYRLAQFDAAEADLRRALESGADAAIVGHNLALVRLARGDRPAAADRAGR